MIAFDAGALLPHLESLSPTDLDALAFGVIGFDRECRVDLYSRTESAAAGLPTASVLGLHVFQEVAPCMNNFLVAQRFEDEPSLDAIIDYVLTLRMRPTPVRLRLLQSPAAARRYIAIERR